MIHLCFTTALTRLNSNIIDEPVNCIPMHVVLRVNQCVLCIVFRVQAPAVIIIIQATISLVNIEVE